MINPELVRLADYLERKFQENPELISVSLEVLEHYARMNSEDRATIFCTLDNLMRQWRAA